MSAAEWRPWWGCTPDPPRIHSWKDGGINQADKNVWKYTSRCIVRRTGLTTLSTSEHDISPSCYGRYLQYVPCVLVDLPGGGPGRIESPSTWLWFLAGGRIPSGTVSGGNLLKLNKTFTIWSTLSSFCHPLKPCNLTTRAHHTFLWQFYFWWGIILAVVINRPGRPSLSLEHRSLTLGLSGNIDEPMAPRYLPSSSPGALHPSLSQSLEGVLSWTLVKIWCIVKWNRVMRNWYWRGGGYWVLMVGEQRYSNGP